MDIPTSWPQTRQTLDALVQTLPAPGESPRGIVTEWPEAASFLEDPDSWEIFFQNLGSTPGGVIRETVLRRTVGAVEQRLALKVYVSSLGPQDAREYFLELALSPSREPRYEIEKEGEALSLRVAAPFPGSGAPVNNDSLLLLYQNVVCEVRSYRSTVDVRRFGRQLLSFATGLEDWDLKGAKEDRAPRLSHHEGGSEIVVDLPAAPDSQGNFGATDFDVQVYASGEVIFQGFEGQTARFRKLGGEGNVHVQAIDRRTLLTSELKLRRP